jgi:hypothetical protein
MPEPHPDLEPLAFLVGTWVGRGHGDYSTIEPFDYLEELTIAATGKPFLRYDQRTRDPETGEPLHTETGFWRPGRPGRVELVLVQPTGIVEVDEGVLEGRSIRVRSRMVGLTRTAKPVSTVERILDVDGDRMRYELHMEAVGREHQFHLAATLTRA